MNLYQEQNITKKNQNLKIMFTAIFNSGSKKCQIRKKNILIRNSS